MRRYNILQSLVMAFYSRSLYRDVAQNWRGFSFLYLLFLVAICYLPWVIGMHVSVTHLVKSVEPWVEQVPTIKITNGEVSIDQPVPFLIHDPKTQQVVAIIDTSNTINDFKESTATIMLTNNKVFVKDNNEIKTYDLSKIKNKTYDQGFINKLLPFLHYFVAFAYPFVTLFYFLWALIETLFYAALVKLFVKTELSYGMVCCLSAVALTPKFILAMILGIFALTFPYKWVIYFALGLGYLFFAVDSNLEAEHPVEQK